MFMLHAQFGRCLPLIPCFIKIDSLKNFTRISISEMAVGKEMRSLPLTAELPSHKRPWRIFGVKAARRLHQ